MGYVHGTRSGNNNAEKQRFALPEFRAFTIVRAEVAPFAAKVEVPEDEIRKLYEFKKDTLSTAEKRSFVQLSGAPDRATAETTDGRYVIYSSSKNIDIFQAICDTVSKNTAVRRMIDNVSVSHA